MRSLIGLMRSGEWLTPERRRMYPLIVLALTLIVAVTWIATSPGLIDRMGSPIGTDFTNVYAAGTLALDGKVGDAYDPPSQHRAEIAIFGQVVPFYGWHYPPMFLTIAALLALLPYAWALFAWMTLTLVPYLAALHVIVPRRETLLIGAAFPAVFVNLGHGQNGFLTAALIGGALFLLDRRPLVAGVLIGLLAYKPQFGVLIPLVLVATGRWKTIAAAAATLLVECAIATVLFGFDIWTAFAGSAKFTREVVLEEGQTGWQKIQSLFSAVRMWGGSVETAYAAQFVLALVLAVTVSLLWRSRASFDLKAAALVVASLLATPYMLDYDLVAIGIAIAFHVRHGLRDGFADWEISLLAFAWVTPLVARSVALLTHVPLGLFAMLALYAFTLAKATADPARTSRRERLAGA